MRQPRLPTDVSTSSAATAATGCRCGRCSCSSAAPGARSRGSPTARAAAAAAIAGGRLYVVGGIDGRRSLARVALSRSRSGRTSWTRIPARARGEHLAAAASRGRVYAIGGRAAGIDTNKTDFEVYDAAAKRWRRLAPLPGARGGTGAAALGGRIVSVGGEEPAGTIRSVTPTTCERRWSRLPDLPTPRTDSAWSSRSTTGLGARGRPRARA